MDAGGAYYRTHPRPTGRTRARSNAAALCGLISRASYRRRRALEDLSDVVVDGVSLAGNFRAQFTKTIRASSYDALVQRIETKLAEEQ